MALKTKTSSEIEVLFSYIDQQKHTLLMNGVSGGIKGPEKDKEWDKMTRTVNAVLIVVRSVTEIKE